MRAATRLVPDLAIALAACCFLAACRDAAAPAQAPASAPSSAAASSADPYPILLPTGEQAQAGHVLFQLVAARIDRRESGAGGEAKTLAVRVSLQATELESRDTSMTSNDVRLLAGGRAYAPEKPANVRFWASQSVDVPDMVFVVPAPLETASLQLNTADGATALLALRLPE